MAVPGRGPGDRTVNKPAVIPEGSLRSCRDRQMDIRHMGIMLRISEGAKCQRYCGGAVLKSVVGEVFTGKVGFKKRKPGSKM